jgi:polyhydroxyalkanoate synthesis regulator phasin
MVDGINANYSLNWYALLSAQKKQTSESSKKGSGSSDGLDSAEFSQMAFGLGGTGPRQDPLEQLVNDGTITSGQASAIGQALQSARQSGQQPDSGNDPLASLVSAGTITQDQANSVKSALEAARPDQEQKGFMSNVLDNLVSNGTITQDQADSVKQSLLQGHHHHHGKPPSAPANDSSSASSLSAASSSSDTEDTTDLSGLSAEDILQLLVSGKISSQQAETALRQLESNETSGATSSASLDSSSGSNRADPLGSLVANGTITQDQENAIKSAFKQAMDANRAIQAYAIGAASM